MKFSIPTNVKMLKFGKQPTKNQAIKNDPAKDLALLNSKKR